LSLKQKNGAVSEVKVYEVFGLVRDEGSEIAAYNTVPGWTFTFIELGELGRGRELKGEGGRTVFLIN
jgi:hypothetical protein